MWQKQVKKANNEQRVTIPSMRERGGGGGGEKARHGQCLNNTSILQQYENKFQLKKKKKI